MTSMTTIREKFAAGRSAARDRALKWGHWYNDRMHPRGVLIVLFVMTWILLIQSPLFFLRNAAPGVDSSVFLTVGKVMKDGGMPYRDTFDHKGPLLYILNWLGVSISLPRGILLVEFFFDFFAFYFMYQTARLVSSRLVSTFCAICAMTLISFYFEGGNFVEEYAMAFIAASVFIFMDYFLNDRISLLRLAVCGFCLGCVFLLRPNMIPVWVVGCVAVLAQIIRDGKWSRLPRFILPFAGGFLLVTAPVFIWLAVNHAMEPFLYQYFTFNFSYSLHNEASSFRDRYKAFLYFFSPVPVFLSSAECVKLWSDGEKNHRILGACGFGFVVFTVFMNCLSGQQYGHYGLIICPAVVFPMAMLVIDLGKLIRPLRIKAALLAFLLAVCTVTNAYSLFYGVVHVISNLKGPEYSSCYLETAEFIDAHTSPDDGILVCGNTNVVYLFADRKPATTYSFSYPITLVNEQIHDDYYAQIREKRPALVVVPRTYAINEMLACLDENGYSLVWSSSTADKSPDLYNGFLIYMPNN